MDVRENNKHADKLLYQNELHQSTIYFTLLSDFRSSSVFFNITNDTYVTHDNIYYNIHTCTYLARLQVHESDIPSYREVIRSSEEECNQ